MTTQSFGHHQELRALADLDGFPCGKVLAAERNDTVAGAVIDTNSDSQLLVFHTFWRGNENEAWSPELCQGAGSFGCGVGAISYVYGQGASGDEVVVRYRGRDKQLHVGDSGWWLSVWRDHDWAENPVPPVVIPR